MEIKKDGAASNPVKTGKEYTGSKQGMQGTDKAPGEETATDQVHFTRETQKGKKVDADPTEDEGKPEKQDL